MSNITRIKNTKVTQILTFVSFSNVNQAAADEQKLATFPKSSG